jgi:acetyl-CoA carboxylase biotin carboxylase subunit
VQRVLVANRGEIAVRVIRACTDEGLEAVAAVSEADRDSLPAHLADEAVCIGPASPAESYLDVNRVIAAAAVSGCDALHPGYGFLSERPELAAACAEEGITFIGPSAEMIRRGGDKVVARELASSLGVPLGAGSETVATGEEAETAAAEVGYPVILKAAAGGGGKGMVVVTDPGEVAQRFQAASFQALSAFGDGRVYVEHYITNARHVEVQILADTHGSVIHLGERDCSYQRRYQKLLEEGPGSDLPAAMRAELQAAAVAIARELKYVGAATVEFVVDLDAGTFSFLEINTRVQVEHPVTEMITGVDIVRAQLRVAAGERLGIEQSDVVLSGHAIECRINAESADRGFLPSPGRIERWFAPVSSYVRVDTHCYPGYDIPPYYDSLLAKVIVWGEDRDQAITRMERALRHLEIDGVATTVPFHQAVLAHPDFRARRINTKWVEDVFLPMFSTDRLFDKVGS